MSFVATYLYFTFKEGGENADLNKAERINPAYAWILLAATQAIFVLSFLFFLRNIERRYVVTFYSLDSGKTFCRNWFQKTTDETDRICIFDTHPDLYKSFEDRIIEWCCLNWERWSEDKPFFFTSKLFDKIPAHMLRIIREHVQKKGSLTERRGSVRRSSVGSVPNIASSSLATRGIGNSTKVAPIVRVDGTEQSHKRS
jgi:hypothetical protein